MIVLDKTSLTAAARGLRAGMAARGIPSGHQACLGTIAGALRFESLNQAVALLKQKPILLHFSRGELLTAAFRRIRSGGGTPSAKDLPHAAFYDPLVQICRLAAWQEAIAPTLGDPGADEGSLDLEEGCTRALMAACGWLAGQVPDRVCLDLSLFSTGVYIGLRERGVHPLPSIMDLRDVCRDVLAVLWGEGGGPASRYLASLDPWRDRLGLGHAEERGTEESQLRSLAARIEAVAGPLPLCRGCLQAGRCRSEEICHYAGSPMRTPGGEPWRP